MMTYTILGIFQNKGNAEEAINHLREDGFNPKDISIILRNENEGREISHNTGVSVAEGAAGGIATGAIIGALAGLVASFMIPGVGAFFIGGPIAASLGLTGAAATTASGAATGALAGGLIGALTEFGLSREEASHYESRIKEGGILVAVPADDEDMDDVKDILKMYHATDINSVEHQESHRLSYRGHNRKEKADTHAQHMHRA